MTTPIIASIVEGHGEVQSIRSLVSRIALEIHGVSFVEQPPPYRLSRGQMTKSSEMNRVAQFARSRVPMNRFGGVLILCDADDDCPVDLAKTIAIGCAPIEAHVVVALREFEAWFLAGWDLEEPEVKRDAKSAAADYLGAAYKPTVDQARLVTSMDLSGAFDRSRSFRRMVEVVGALVTQS